MRSDVNTQLSNFLCRIASSCRCIDISNCVFQCSNYTTIFTRDMSPIVSSCYSNQDYIFIVKRPLKLRHSLNLKLISQTICQKNSKSPQFRCEAQRWYWNSQTGFLNEAFDSFILIQEPVRGFVYKPDCDFQYELLNLASNLRTLEQNLEHFGKKFLWNRL